jgi:hypothetical protein
MNHRYLHEINALKNVVPANVYGIVSSSVQGAHAVAAQVGGEGAQTIAKTADRAFVSGMTEAMLVASLFMLGAALFTFLVLPAETRCIEPECEEEVILFEAGMPVPEAGD